MPAHHSKLIILSVLLVSLLACVNTGGLTPDTSERNRMLSVVFDESQRKEFFHRLEDFAHSHEFEFEINSMDADLLPYAASLLREDRAIDVFVEELTLDFDVSPRPTMIYFIGGDAENPTDEAIKLEIDTLVNDLLESIGDLPTIKITDVSCKDKTDKDWRDCLETAFS